MKKNLFILCLVVVTAITTGFNYVADHSAAKAQQYEGIYIFDRSTPVDETNYLGTVKVPPIVKNNKASTLLNNLIKKARKDYPTVQALIIKDEDFETADVVTFK